MQGIILYEFEQLMDCLEIIKYTRTKVEFWSNSQIILEFFLIKKSIKCFLILLSNKIHILWFYKYNIKLKNPTYILVNINTLFFNCRTWSRASKSWGRGRNIAISLVLGSARVLIP